MQTNPAVEQNKTLNGPLVREISPVGVWRGDRNPCSGNNVYIDHSSQYYVEFVLMYLLNTMRISF